MVARSGGVEFVLDEAALQRLLASSDGPVAKYMARVGAQVENRAKELLSGELVNVDTGRLRASTTWRVFVQGGRIGVAVGSGVDYAQLVHEETRYLDGRPYLVFAVRDVLGPVI